MARSRLETLPPGEMEPVHKPEEYARPKPAPREAALVDLKRALGHDMAIRIAETAEALAHAPLPVAAAEIQQPEEERGGYFQPGGYAGRVPGSQDTSAPDRYLWLGEWVKSELNRAGLPQWLREVVMRMSLVTMREGVEVARRVLLEERCVPEQYHFAINGILKLVPPLI